MSLHPEHNFSGTQRGDNYYIRSVGGLACVRVRVRARDEIRGRGGERERIKKLLSECGAPAPLQKSHIQNKWQHGDGTACERGSEK
jgi:hypothetical protein